MGEQKRLVRRQNERLKAELRRQGRSLRWFCQQMGVSRYTLWRIETGDAGAPPNWYGRAAQVLGVPEYVVAPEELAAA